MPSFEEILRQTTENLRRRGKVSFRAIKRQFDIDDEYLKDIIYELVEIHGVAQTEDDRMLVWTAPAEEDPIGGHDTKPDSKSISAEPVQQVAERRQLTVMFTDLVGSTELSRILDPEDLRDVLYAYQDLFDSIVLKHQGKVIQHLGDGIMAYFGYPQAHEDDPQRAIRSGLEMLSRIHELNEQLQLDNKVTLQIRIGIHTGVVVVGATGGTTHSEMLALGEAPNLAARIQDLAQANTLVISSTTNKLLRGQFKTELLGHFKMKGFSQKIELFKVEGEKDISEIELVPSEGLSPFVGREVERTQILERWDLSRGSKGQVVLISGDAGIGKSRLVQSIVSEILIDDVPYLVFKCSPYNRNTALSAVINTLKAEIQLDRKDSDAKRLLKLEQFVGSKGLSPKEDLPIIAELLSIPLLDKYEEINVAGARLKDLTFQSLTKWLAVVQGPSLILFEDFQWADPSTLELFENFFTKIPSLPILFVGTFRPEFTPDWPGGSHEMHIVLNRLTRQQTEYMIRQLAGVLPEYVIADIQEKTDGNPLFVEEVTKLLLESGVLVKSQQGYQLQGSLKSLSIPSTLQDSLMARLDRLGLAKEIAQIGATVGREFSYALVKAISKLEDGILSERLLQLVAAEMLHVRGEMPLMTYTFKHALIQETAYNSLLKKRRQKFHRRIVETFESDFPDLVETNPELMAHHCSEGGLLEKAIPFWHRAGELAISKSAHQEAIVHLNEGLNILQKLPVSDEHIENEIKLQIALGVPLTALRGYGSEDVEQAYNRARTLCAKLGNTMQLIPTLYGLWRYYLLTAQYGEAQYLSQQLMELSAQSKEPLHSSIAHRATGSTHFYLGQLDQARTILGQVEQIEAAQDDSPEPLLVDVVDAWVTCRSYESWTLWLQGEVDQAIKQIHSAVEMANHLNHPFSMALSTCFATWLHQFQGDRRNTLKFARKSLTISKQNGFAFWIGWAEIMEAWALDKDPRDEKHLEAMYEGFEHWKSLGSRLGSSYFLYLIAESLMRHGNLNEAWNSLEEARSFMKRTEEGWWASEIYRLEGKLYELESASRPDLAEASYRKALEVANSQNSRSLALRAANSLAMHLADSPKHTEAYSILNESLEWFDEELDTPDLREARNTLKGLAAIKN